MIGKASQPTAEEKHRIEVCKLHVSCLPCLLNWWPNVHADYHHVVSDGESRDGHSVGYPSCLWHHRGLVDGAVVNKQGGGITPGWMLERFGPSFELHRKLYTERYGTELQLVDTATFAVRLFDQRPWLEFDIPPDVASQVRMFHEKLRLSG